METSWYEQQNFLILKCDIAMVVMWEVCCIELWALYTWYAQVYNDNDHYSFMFIDGWFVLLVWSLPITLFSNWLVVFSLPPLPCIDRCGHLFYEGNSRGSAIPRIANSCWAKLCGDIYYHLYTPSDSVYTLSHAAIRSTGCTSRTLEVNV